MPSFPNNDNVSLPAATIFKKTTVSLQQFSEGRDIGNGSVNAIFAIQNAINYAAANDAKLIIPKPSRFYKVDGSGLKGTSNGFNTPQGTYIEWEEGAWIRPASKSAGGAWFSNKRARPFKRSNITLINPQIDGVDEPVDAPDYNGDNAIGFAGGYELDGSYGTVSQIRIEGGHIRNFLATFRKGGPGGKAVNFEEGAFNCVVDGLHAENCTYPCFVSPTTSDPNKFIRHVIFKNILVRQCATLFYYIGDNTAKGTIPPTDMQMSSVRFEGTGYDVGHFPDRTVSGNHEKSAPIIINGGSNIILNARIYNAPDYPSPAHPAGGTRYPTGYPDGQSNCVGGGLSGPIGAVVWGWGRNCKIDVEYYGNCDDVVRLQRSRAHGADSYAAGETKPVGSFDFDVRVRQSGVALTAVRAGQTALKGKLLGGNLQAAILPYNASRRDGEYVGIVLKLTDGPGTGQFKKIIAYDGKSRTATLSSPLSVPAEAGTGFILGADYCADPDQISGTIEVSGSTLTEAPVQESASQYSDINLKFNGNGGAREHGTLRDVADKFRNRVPGRGRFQ